MNTENKFPEKKALPNLLAKIVLILGCICLAGGFMFAMNGESGLIFSLSLFGSGIAMITSYAFIDLFICIEHNQRIQIYYIDDTKLEHLPKD